MPAALMILLQATAPAPGPSSLDGFDLGRLAAGTGVRLGIDEPCASTDPDVIVVCGVRSDERYRLRILPSGDFEVDPLKAEIGLGEGLSGGVEMNSVAMPSGLISKRVMIKVTKDF